MMQSCNHSRPIKAHTAKLFVCFAAMGFYPWSDLQATETKDAQVINGVVIDGLGRPVDQAELSFDPLLYLRSHSDGTFSGEIKDKINTLCVSVRKDGYVPYRVDFGPRWQECHPGNLQLVLRKATTLAQVEQLARLNGDELKAGVRGLLGSSWGEAPLLDNKDSAKIMDALFQMEHHIRPTLKTLVPDERVGKSATCLLQFIADDDDADLCGKDNPFKPLRPIAAKTPEAAITELGRGNSYLSDARILGKQLNQDGTKALVHCNFGGACGEWYIFCFHKKKTQWILKSMRCTAKG